MNISERKNVGGSSNETVINNINMSITETISYSRPTSSIEASDDMDAIFTTILHYVDPNDQPSTVDKIITELYSISSAAKYYGLKEIFRVVDMNCRFVFVLQAIKLKNILLIPNYFNSIKRIFWTLLELNSTLFRLKNNNQSDINKIEEQPKMFHDNTAFVFNLEAKNRKNYNFEVNLTEPGEINSLNFRYRCIRNIIANLDGIEPKTIHQLMEIIHYNWAPFYYFDENIDNENLINWSTQVFYVIIGLASANHIFDPNSNLYKSFRICFWECMNKLANQLGFYKEDLTMEIELDNNNEQNDNIVQTNDNNEQMEVEKSNQEKKQEKKEKEEFKDLKDQLQNNESTNTTENIEEKQVKRTSDAEEKKNNRDDFDPVKYKKYLPQNGKTTNVNNTSHATFSTKSKNKKEAKKV